MIQNKKKVGFAHQNLENWHILLSGEVHEINRLCKFTVTNRNMYFETNHKAKGSCFVHWCNFAIPIPLPKISEVLYTFSHHTMAH